MAQGDLCPHMFLVCETFMLCSCCFNADVLQWMQARQKMWNSLSQPARDQFAWPHPGLPLPQEDDQGKQWSETAVAPGAHHSPLSPFCLVILEPWAVDYLSLRGNRRIKFARVDDEKGTSWAETPVNP